MPLKRALALVSPAEWVVLAFAAYLLAHVREWSGTLAHTSLPRADMICVMLGIASFRAGLEYRRMPWPSEHRSSRVGHFVVLPVLLAPVVLVAVGDPERWPSVTESDRIVRVVLLVRAWVTQIGQLVIPVFLLWLATGIQVKRTGSLSVVATARANGRAALAAIRDWLPPLVMVYAYGFMAVLTSHPVSPDRDAELFAADRFITFGHEPVVAVQRLVTPWLSETLSLAYMSYIFFFPIALGAVYAVGTRAQFREAAFAATFAMAVGYTFYTLVPAQGPIFTIHYDVSLTDYTLDRIQKQLSGEYRVPRDCFPSLHTCLSWLFTYQTWRVAPRVAYVLAPFALLIPFACVYLRYHYLTDIVAGLVLVLATCLLARRLAKRGLFER